MEWWRTPVVQGLLWGAAVVAAVWILVPALVHLIRPGRVHHQLLEDPAGPEPRPDDPAYTRAVRALAEMGFRPMGRVVQKMWFPSPLRWRYHGDGPAWMSPDGTILVTMFRLPNRSVWVTDAITLFAGEAYLQTVSFKLGLAVLEGDKRRVELDNIEPAVLIAAHRRLVEDFARERAVPLKETSYQEAVRLASTNHDFRAKLDRIAGSIYVVLVAYVAFLCGVLPRLGSHGWSSSLRPVAILAAAAWFWLLWRIPAPRRHFRRLVGFAVIVAMFLPPLVVLDRLGSSGTATALFAALDRLDAEVVSGRAEEGIDQAERLGPTACGATLTRYADPQTAPDTRQALHTILVRWNGGDLGEQAQAWVPWCNGVLGLK